MPRPSDGGGLELCRFQEHEATLSHAAGGELRFAEVKYLRCDAHELWQSRTWEPGSCTPWPGSLTHPVSLCPELGGCLIHDGTL